ncbi:MAG: hypothetical protein LC667_14055 [Thioalkalivibrio sp.]|nr:hypothetical protein [Thioalkalivibrio sp.]
MTDVHSTAAPEISPRAEGLQAFIDQSVEKLRRSGARGDTAPDGLLFFGSWNDSIPRLLIRDPILKPIEVRLWSVMRTLVEPAGPATMPDYDTLTVYCNVGSRSTVSHALPILRITRWISLCARVRDASGRYAGNVYALHDEPTTLGDAMHLDAGYVAFLREMTGHRNVRVRRVAQSVLDTIEEAIEEGQDVTRDTGLHVRVYQRVSFFGCVNNPVDGSGDAPLAVSGPHRAALKQRVQKVDLDQVQKVDSGNENKEKQSLINQVQKMDSVSCSSSNNKKTTTTKDVAPTLIWPKRLSSGEQALVCGYFTGLGSALAQNVLDELQGRLQDGSANPVRNPVAWLIASSKRAAAGEFQLTSLGFGVRRARARQLALDAEDTKARASPRPPWTPRTRRRGHCLPPSHQIRPRWCTTP